MKIEIFLSAARFSFLSAVYLLAAFSSHAAVRYVDASSASPSPPFTDWSTAAATIQAAVDAADAGDEVLVTNGVYRFGGNTNRVSVTKQLVVRSVNGPDFTAIEGSHGITNFDRLESAVRCVYLTNGAVLSGFTLTNGGASGWPSYGGGVYCQPGENGVVSNCVITHNQASVGAGVSSCTLYNCTLRENWAMAGGGGASQATLFNCTIISNSAYAVRDPLGKGGGADGCTLSGCRVIGNVARCGGGGASSSRLSNCKIIWNSSLGAYNDFSGGGLYFCYQANNCLIVSNSAVLPGGGAHQTPLTNSTVVGNVAPSAGGAYRCSVENCIVYSNTATDAPNYLACTVDYTCTTPEPTPGVGNITADPLFVDAQNGNFRLQPNSPCINIGLNADVCSPTDLDGNPRVVGRTVDLGAFEFQGGSDALQISSVLASGGDMKLTWRSVAGLNYFVECSTNLPIQASFVRISNDIPGQNGTTSYTHTNAVATQALFYRVGIRSK